MGGSASAARQYKPVEEAFGGSSDGSRPVTDKVVGLEDVIAKKGISIAVAGRYTTVRRLDQDYSLDSKVIGSGMSGPVQLATGRSGGQKYAVKSFRKIGLSARKREELKSEVEIYLALDHPHIARLEMVYETDEDIHLVMEFMAGGELYDRLSQRKQYSEECAAETTHMMLLAVAYLHGSQIAHRDLKLENFLYERKDSDHLKLIDFGFSHVWEPNTTMASSVGTLPYMAPEVLHQRYTSKCDLWSMGVITFILLAGYMPFGGGEGEQIACIKAGKWNKKPDRWAMISETAQDFVNKLIVVDPNERLSAEQALRHPYIAEWDRKREGAHINAVDNSIVDALQAFAEVSHFRRACLSVMAWSLTSEESASVRDAFLAIDLNKEGTITLNELKQCLSDKIDITDAQVKPIFDAINVRQNEEIHYSEFLAAMMTSRIAMNDDLLSTTFRRFDTDKSGYITTANLLQVLGTNFAGADVSQLIKEAGFRDSGKISYEEFIKYLKGGHCDTKLQRATSRVIDESFLEERSRQVSSSSKNIVLHGGGPQSALQDVFLQAFEPAHLRRPAAIAADEHRWCGCLSGIAQWGSSARAS